MIKHAMGLLLLSAALAAACGCNVCRAIVNDPFGPNTLCDARRCGPVCEEPCGPIRGRFGPRAVMAEPCEDDCGGECGLPACGRRCRPRGPLAFVFALFTAGAYPGCWGGCGERYWGDWYGDPPDCSDPCDCQGNFTGGGYSTFGEGGSLGMAGPYQDAPVPAPSGGCRTCGQGGQASYNRGGRYPAQYSAGSQQFAATQPYGVQRSATQSPAAGQRSPARYASRGNRAAAQYPSKSSASGSYAPRLISTTDRVVKPATGDQGPRLAQPQRADVVQE